jgi:hypothetical protein
MKSTYSAGEPSQISRYAHPERVEQRLQPTHSKKIVKYVLTNPGKFACESENPERALNRSFTMRDADWRDALPGEPACSREEHVNTHHGNVAEDFLATVPERISFWSEIRRDTLAVEVESEETLAIGSYLERLRWIFTLCADSEFAELEGSHRLAVIATAVMFGPDAAVRIWRESELSDHEVEGLLWAQNELIFMVEHDRGSAIEFKPGRTVG